MCTTSFSMVLTTLLLALLHTSLKWLSLLHLWLSLLHLSHLLPCAGHHLSLCSYLQYLHLLLVMNVFVVGLLSVCLTSLCMIVSKLFVLCKLLITTVWALWASTLFSQVSTFSLCMAIFYSHFVSSLIISTGISSSFKPYFK